MSGDANNSDGLVYELTPSSSGWNETVLYSFSATSEGATPQAGLIIDSAGNLYGTTISGDKGIGAGNVFELSPSSSGWVYSVLHKFTATPDGEGPGGLVLDATEVRPKTLFDEAITPLKSGIVELHQIADNKLVEIDNLLPQFRKGEELFVPTGSTSP